MNSSITTMNRSLINPMPQFFDRYIKLVEDINVVEALEKYRSPFSLLNEPTLRSLADKRYAPEKWTIKDILQHLVDNERVQSYRAMRFARNDNSSLPGYDENLFADNANAAGRTMDELLEEFSVVRKSTILLYKSFTEEMMMRSGICFNVDISVLALGFQIAGHQIHHFNVIRERYLHLSETSN